MANPYATDHIVRAPDMLFGRQVHLRRLLQRARDLDCAAVAGPPGIGKSSLLYRLAHEEALQTTHLCVYFDLSDTALQSPGAFVGRVLEELGQQAGRPFPGSSISDLRQALITLRDEERLHVLFFLDEFDQFAIHADGSDVFLEALRELGFARLFSLVMASPHSLAELAVRNVISHRFVRLFEEQVELSLLPARDAERLIQEPAAREGVEFSAEALALARELGGRYPLFLQLAGCCLFEQALSSEGMDLEAVRERFAKAAFPHLHRLWSFLTVEEREAARYYAGTVDVHPPSVSVRQALIQKGIIERRAGTYRLFSVHAADVVRSQRQRLEEPLPPPETVSATAGPEEVVAPEGAVISQEVVVEEPTPLAEEALPRPEVGRPPVVPPAAGPEPEEVPVERPEDTPSEKTSSLAALGCYVLAITLDLLLVAGIVIARQLFRLSSREMYILVGVAAVFPVLILLLNRLAGDLWARLFDRLLPRL